MPRDLGQAKRADLSGHFVGESSEQAGPLVNYLIGAGQLAVPGDGAPSSGRNQRDTELATRRLATAALRKDTEVADRARPPVTELAADTVFEAPPAKPPVLRPSANKPPTAQLAPQSIEIEDLAELAMPEDGLTEDSEARTEVQKPRAMVGPVPLNPAETGVLSMDAMTLADDDKLTSEELRADDDTHLRVGMDPAERATNRVKARPAQPARRADGVMHDTVNFYNQTQALKTGQMPQPAQPIAGTVPLKGRPTEYPPLPSRRYEPPPPPPADKDVLLEVEPFDADTGFRSDTAVRGAAGQEDTARRDTDRYPEDERKPPGMQKLLPETDTQKLEMQLMPALPTGDEDASSDSNYDATTILLPGAPASRVVEMAPPLPPAAAVRADFQPAPGTSAGDRIVPEIIPAPQKPEAQHVTEKVVKAAPPVKAPQLAPASASMSETRTEAAPMAVQELPPGRTVHDHLFSEQVTKRHESTRDDTGELLEHAGTLANKLRQATEESRSDLLSLSARRRTTRPMDEPKGERTEVEQRPTRNITEDKKSDGRPTHPVPLDDSVRLLSEMPTARAKRARVPTQAIGDIVAAIESKLGEGDEPLSNLLKEASRRITRQMHADAEALDDAPPPRPRDEDDVDHLVAASAALRAVIESEHEADRARGNTPTEEVPMLPSSARVVAETPLAKDLDRMWREFSIRKTGVIPKAGLASVAKTGAGRTQGGLWWKLAGISVACFLIGGAFVYVLMQFFGVSLR